MCALKYRFNTVLKIYLVGKFNKVEDNFRVINKDLLSINDVYF